MSTQNFWDAECSAKKDINSNTNLPQDIIKASNKQPNLFFLKKKQKKKNSNNNNNKTKLVKGKK